MTRQVVSVFLVRLGVAAHAAATLAGRVERRLDLSARRLVQLAASLRPDWCARCGRMDGAHEGGCAAAPGGG